MNTEARNPRSTRLDELTAVEIVGLMNDEESTVMDAMRAARAASRSPRPARPRRSSRAGA